MTLWGLILQRLGCRKLTFLPNEERTNIETKLLEVRHMSRPKLFLPQPTGLRFETGVFKRVGDLHINPKCSKHVHTDYVFFLYTG